ncbi:hypothetical protein D9M69_705500 [compost metagenome]
MKSDIHPTALDVSHHPALPVIFFTPVAGNPVNAGVKLLVPAGLLFISNVWAWLREFYRVNFHEINNS